MHLRKEGNNENERLNEMNHDGGVLVESSPGVLGAGGQEWVGGQVHVCYLPRHYLPDFREPPTAPNG